MHNLQMTLCFWEEKAWILQENSNRSKKFTKRFYQRAQDPGQSRTSARSHSFKLSEKRERHGYQVRSFQCLWQSLAQFSVHSHGEIHILQKLLKLGEILHCLSLDRSSGEWTINELFSGLSRIETRMPLVSPPLCHPSFSAQFPIGPLSTDPDSLKPKNGS